MAKLFNRAKMTTATTGSGTVTLGSASNGFQTFAAAGVSNGDVVQYVIEEGANFEIGTGTYSSTGTSLTRSPTESSNSDNAITLAGQATVSITAVADDLNRLQHGGSDKVTVSSTGASVAGNLAVSGTVDGRDVASDGSKLDGIESGATGDQTNAEIRAAVEAASDSNVFTDADHTKLNGIEANAKNDQTITAGGGLTGGGTGDVTISHSDTSSQASVNGSGRTYIQDITLDTYGHVTGLATATETVVNTDTNTIPNNATITLSAGGALTGGGNFTTDQSSNETITFNHSDTSSQGSVNNSSGTVIQDVTLDGYGHVTGLASVNLDGRYYTETEADSRFVNVTGDTVSGNLTVNSMTFKNNSNVSRNLKIQPSSSSTDVGASFFNGAGNWTMQLYGYNSGSTQQYGFLDANWGGWDIQKTVNGVFKVDEGGGLQRVFNDGYHPNADKWTTARTLSLTGDVTGSVSWDGSGNASLSTTVGNDSHTHSISTITDEHRLFNNMGNNHGTYTNFNSINQFGVRFVQGGTNGPTGIAGHQWYGFTLGLGNEYTGLNSSGDYGSQFYWARQGQSGGAYIWIRDQENGNWGSWRKPYAGKADAWTSSRTLSLTGAVTGSVSWDGSGNASLSTSFNDNGPNYIDVATGNYGTVKVDDDRGVSGAWAGYAIRDDWVFMANGAAEAGVYNDTDNEWAIRFIRNAETELYHNGSLKLETSANGIEMSGRIDMNNNDIYGCDQLFHHGDTDTYMQFHAANQWRVVVGGSERLEVKNSSPHVLVSGDLNSTSDERLKKNIKPIDNALDDICQLEGVTFDWKDTGTQGQGFIAQQVEPIIPDVVNTDEDTGMKSINYVGLIGHLVEAIKSQQTQIDDLKAEIQSMKS